MMMEWRLVWEALLPVEGEPIDIGMVLIGTLPDGRGIYDCLNAPEGLGEQISRGRHRRERAPWWVRRHVNTAHKWSGE